MKFELGNSMNTVRFAKDNGTTVIGGLNFNGGKMSFSGNAEESAQIFMQVICDKFNSRLNKYETALRKIGTDKTLDDQQLQEIARKALEV